MARWMLVAPLALFCATAWAAPQAQVKIAPRGKTGIEVKMRGWTYRQGDTYWLRSGGELTLNKQTKAKPWSASVRTMNGEVKLTRRDADTYVLESMSAELKREPVVVSGRARAINRLQRAITGERFDALAGSKLAVLARQDRKLVSAVIASARRTIGGTPSSKSIELLGDTTLIVRDMYATHIRVLKVRCDGIEGRAEMRRPYLSPTWSTPAVTWQTSSAGM